MSKRANIAPGYLLRMGLIGVVCVGFCGWCIYDGVVGWPAERVRALEYLDLKEKEEYKGPANEKKLEEKWEEIAAEKGWSSSKPEEPKTDAEISVQFIMAGLAGVIALPFLFILLVNRGRWIESSDEGLTTSWGQQLKFEQITTLDKKLWRNKGIAKVNYTDAGSSRRIVLDDCKYDRHATEDMLRLVESKIESDQITGGEAQSLPEDNEAAENASGDMAEQDVATDETS